MSDQSPIQDVKTRQKTYTRVDGSK